MIPWHSIAYDFLDEKWYPDDEVTAGHMIGLHAAPCPVLPCVANICLILFFCYLAIPDTISAVAAPFFGLFVDTMGFRGYIMLLCSLCLALVHAFLGYSDASPVTALVFLGQFLGSAYLSIRSQFVLFCSGIAYAMYAAAVWPSVSFLVPEKRLGMAYGISTCKRSALVFDCFSAALIIVYCDIAQLH